MEKLFSRISDPQFISELRNILAIEFEETLAKPDIAKIVPDTSSIVQNVRAGIRIPHRTYLDTALRTVSEGYQLNAREQKELRELIFSLD